MRAYGEVAEWLKALLSKSSMRETVSRVRIPPSPPRELGRFRSGFFVEESYKLSIVKKAIIITLVSLKNKHVRRTNSTS